MKLFDLFKKVTPLPEGMHHLQAESADHKPYRVHLRLRRDGSGVFIVNAATVLHLNPTAAEYAYHFVKGTEPDEAAKQIASRYRVQKNIALDDYNEFLDRIETLVTSQDVDPVSYLDFERVNPHSTDLTAPLRLDCALTYQLPKDSQAEYAPVKRVDREMTTEEWQSILDTAWRKGVPHVTFTGGEPTLRADLPDLIAHAEKNGQVCGLLSDGLKLADKDYRQLLLQTGLDHLLFLLQPESETSWRALEAIMPDDLFVTAHITVDAQSAKHINATLERLAALQVKSISLSLADLSLKSNLDSIMQKAADLNITVNFDLPVPYSAQNPVALETEEDEVPSGAGKAWLYVEPDGDVLPAQGMADKVLGNLLKDKWEKIYRAESEIS